MSSEIGIESANNSLQHLDSLFNNLVYCNVRFMYHENGDIDNDDDNLHDGLPRHGNAMHYLLYNVLSIQYSITK